jgi:hypothetical protein
VAFRLVRRAPGRLSHSRILSNAPGLRPQLFRAFGDGLRAAACRITRYPSRIFDDALDAQLLIEFLRFAPGSAMQIVKLFLIIGHELNSPHHSTPTSEREFRANVSDWSASVAACGLLGGFASGTLALQSFVL